MRVFKTLLPLFLGLFIFTIFGCKRSLPSAQVIDEDLRIAVMKLEQQDSSGLYNVRIFPKREFLEADPGLPQKMMYQVDSCFYLMRDSKKVYPSSAEYIASGVPDSFEYLVTFDGLQAGELFFQDEFINKKNYQLTLK